MARERYVDQVRLLVDSLPAVATEEDFAPKDGATQFLRTLVDGAPDFDAIGLPSASELPAVQWEIRNILNNMPASEQVSKHCSRDRRHSRLTHLIGDNQADQRRQPICPLTSACPPGQDNARTEQRDGRRRSSPSL